MRGNKRTPSLNLPIIGLFDEHEFEELRLLMPTRPPVGDSSISTSRATDLSSLQKLALVDSELSEIG